MSDCMNCGEYCGHSHGDLSTEMILLDLIADLRGMRSFTYRMYARYEAYIEPGDVSAAADRAEARLREVSGDE